MEYVTTWFYDVLSFFGLYYKDAKVLFLGLDGAGKTTLLKVLKNGKVDKMAEPTTHAGKEELVYGSLKIEAHDLGGHAGGELAALPSRSSAVRRGWKEFFFDVDGVIFIVDSVDRDRFPEAKGLLGSERLASVPFLVLGNKIDVPSSAGDAELRAGIGLMETTGTDPEATKSTGVRPIELFLVSITKKTNIKPAFDWLSAYLK
ncbi:SAR1 [Symbiodinium sp. KB8]|nr:SAR1 [Symbiodinium sp. KB8]